VRDRDLDIAREVAGRTLSQEVSHRERNLQILQMAMVQLARQSPTGGQDDPRDLDKLIRLESFLRDEPDSRQEIVFADLRNKSTEELREMVRQEVGMLKEVGDPGDAKRTRRAAATES